MTTTDKELATQGQTDSRFLPSELMAPAVYSRHRDSLFANVLSTGDHKVIGRLWIIAAFLFALFSLVANFIVGLERLDTSSVSVLSDPQSYLQWFTLARVSFVFLFAMPLIVGLGSVIVPLQLGASSLAFPKALAAAFWSWLVAGIMLVVSWLTNGGLVSQGGVVTQQTQLSMLSMIVVIVSLLVAAMVLCTTVFTERSQGMSMYNVPLFSWSIMAMASIWMLSLPVAVANLVVMWADARGAAAHSFGAEHQFAQIVWVFDQPQIFSLAIPVFGVLGDLIPSSIGRRLKNYDTAMWAIAALAALSFGAYAQVAFNPQVSTTWLYVVGAVALKFPILAMVFVVAKTLKAVNNPPTITGHFALAVSALLALMAGAFLAFVRVADSFLAPILSAAYRAIKFVTAADLVWLNDLAEWMRSTFNELAGSSLAGGVGQLAVVSALLAIIAGLFYWAPQIFGRTLPAGAGFLIAAALLSGGVISAVANAAAGFMDQPDFSLAPQSGSVETMNLLALVGMVLIGAGVVLTVLLVSAAAFSSTARASTPAKWQGGSLEWLAASPPPPGNFEGPYQVTSEAPLFDEDFKNPYGKAS